MDESEFEEILKTVTPREENDSIKSYRNTTAIACPSCDDPFDDLVVCKQNPTSLDLTLSLDLCVGVVDDQAVIFTHKR